MENLIGLRNLKKWDPQRNSLAKTTTVEGHLCQLLTALMVNCCTEINEMITYLPARTSTFRFNETVIQALVNQAFSNWRATQLTLTTITKWSTKTLIVHVRALCYKSQTFKWRPTRGRSPKLKEAWITTISRQSMVHQRLKGNESLITTWIREVSLVLEADHLADQLVRVMVPAIDLGVQRPWIAFTALPTKLIGLQGPKHLAPQIGRIV